MANLSGVVIAPTAWPAYADVQKKPLNIKKLQKEKEDIISTNKKGHQTDALLLLIIPLMVFHINMNLILEFNTLV